MTRAEEITERMNGLESNGRVGLAVALGILLLMGGCNGGGGGKAAQTTATDSGASDTDSGATASGEAGGTDPGTGGGTDVEQSAIVPVVMLSKPPSFDPVETTVLPGDTLEWSNQGDGPYTVTSDPGTPAGGPNSDTAHPKGVAAGGTYQWKVPAGAASGTKWYYHCRFHGKPGDGKAPGTGMTGVIIVG